MSIAPVNQILDAFEAQLRGEFPEATVETNRVRSVSEEQRELPVLNIIMGADEPLQSASSFERLAALLTLRVVIIDKAPDSRDVIRRMVEYRSRMHSVLMPINSLGLPFRHEVGWLGATEPVTDAKGIDCAAEIETRWQVAYDFPRDNPNSE